MRHGFLAASLVLLAACSRDPERASPAAAPPASASWFADVTAASGVDFVHVNGATEEKHLPETMGAGAAIVDVDEDGDLDLYFVQGGELRQPENAPSRPPNRLFLNDGHARFRDATKESGDAADTHYGMGVAAGDANGDGHVDLFLTNFGPDVLLAGDGHARFQDVTAASGIVDDRWNTGATFFDADADGDLDLFVTSYVQIDLDHEPWCGDRKPGWRSYCHPDAFPGMEDRFWRNRGDGTFEDATASAGFDDPNGKGLSVIATDVDGDGDVDLYVANDSTENRLWLNRGNGTFEDGTLLSGTGVDRYGRAEASMGLAAGDADQDGDLDLFVTGFDDESDTLYTNLGGGVFEDRTVQAGLEQVTRLPVGFGAVLEDFDGDLALDLAIANGHIIDNIRLYHDGKTYAQPALLLRNDGHGRFEDVSARNPALCGTPRIGRGLYAGDLDGDGAPDLVMTQCGGPAIVLRNVVPPVGCVVVSGLPPGSRVVLRTGSGREIVREAGPAPSYLGQCAAAVCFALVQDTARAVRVRPPGGKWSEIAWDTGWFQGRLPLVWSAGGLRVGR